MFIYQQIGPNQFESTVSWGGGGADCLFLLGNRVLPTGLMEWFTLCDVSCLFIYLFVSFYEGGICFNWSHLEEYFFSYRKGDQ